MCTPAVDMVNKVGRVYSERVSRCLLGSGDKIALSRG